MTMQLTDPPPPPESGKTGAQVSLEPPGDTDHENRAHGKWNYFFLRLHGKHDL